MKKLKFTYLLILPFIILSCNTLNKFDHFGVGNTFDESFIVDIPFSENMTFSGSVEFAASDDDTIGDNIDDIEEFKVTQISVKISDFNGNPEAVANGHFFITSNTPNGDIPVGEPISISNLIFSEVYNTDQLLELDLTPATFIAIQEAYLNNQTLTVQAVGDVTEATEDLEIEFTVYMSIEATIRTNN